MKNAATLDARTTEAQRLRLTRFAMALATYCVASIAASFIHLIDLGTMSRAQWGIVLGAAVAINLVFFALFRSGLNLCFRDPSLTAAQIVASTAWGLMPMHWLPQARPLILMLYLTAFSFGMLRLRRRDYLAVFAIVQLSYAGLLLAEWAWLRPDFDGRFELFLWVMYSLVLSWFAFFGGFVSRLRSRLVSQKGELAEVASELRDEIAARERVQRENELLIGELRENLARIRKLGGLLPICASCKKIRDDRGYWNQIEAFISSRSEAEFSHGICPDCARELAPELAPELDA